MNAAKDKGTKAETAVERYAAAEGAVANRQPLRGSDDMGDLWLYAGLRKFVIQVKNVQRMDLAGWVDEAKRQCVNAGGHFGVVWHKRPRKSSPGDWYVTMTGADFIKLLEDRK